MTKYWDCKAIVEIIESLDNNICSHKFELKHWTEGGLRGMDYCGGDVWALVCSRCGIKRDAYYVTYPDDVDWDKIEKMKEFVKNA